MRKKQKIWKHRFPVAKSDRRAVIALLRRKSARRRIAEIYNARNFTLIDDAIMEVKHIVSVTEYGRGVSVNFTGDWFVNSLSVAIETVVMQPDFEFSMPIMESKRYYQ